MDREDAVRWVAENVMQYPRKPCQSDGVNWSTVATFDDGYVSESGFFCRWCGRKVRDGEAEPCEQYPFPAFDLVQLMRRLQKNKLIVRLHNARGERGAGTFFLEVSPSRLSMRTDDPFGDLCDWLVRMHNE